MSDPESSVEDGSEEYSSDGTPTDGGALSDNVDPVLASAAPAALKTLSVGEYGESEELAPQLKAKRCKRPPQIEPKVLEKIRAKLKAAAYTGHAGKQLDVIFGRFDVDGSGQLETAEVRRALRRTLKVPATVLSDREITKLCTSLDDDMSGSISISELVAFVGAEPAVSKRTGRPIPKEKTHRAPASSFTQTPLPLPPMTVTWTSAWPSPRSPAVPKDQVSWAAQTQSGLNSVRALRQEAQGLLTKNMLQRAHAVGAQSDWSSLKRRTNPQEEKLKKGIATSENFAKDLASRLETCERLIRQVYQCVAYLQRNHNTHRAPLSVVEKRLEMRSRRSVQELVRDHLQEALEREQAVLLEGRRQLGEQMSAGRHLLEALEAARDEMSGSMQRKRHAQRLDRSCLACPERVDERRLALPQVQSARAERDQNTDAHTRQWVDSVQELLDGTVNLEEEALRFCSDGDGLLMRIEREVERAGARTTSSMKKRISETMELKRQLEKELKETSIVLSEAQWSLEQTQKQLDRRPAEPRDTEATRQNVAALEEQYQRTKAFLDQLAVAHQHMTSDLRCKTSSLKIDEACTKVTPSKELERDCTPTPISLTPRGGARAGDLQLPSLQKSSGTTPRKPPPLEKDVEEKLRSRMKAAAYTGHSGRQLDVVFGRFDVDSSGQLETEEVRRALRRTLRIPASVISDAEIASLCAMLDQDGSGSVSIAEIVNFVGPEPEVSKRCGRTIRNAVLDPIQTPRTKYGPRLEADTLDRLRSKIKAAAYTGHSGRQLDVLFGRFDIDGSGQLEVEEVRRALRRTLRIPASAIPDTDISSLCGMLDSDKSGTVSVSELVDFIGAEPELSKRSGRSLRCAPCSTGTVRDPSASQNSCSSQLAQRSPEACRLSEIPSIAPEPEPKPDCEAESEADSEASLEEPHDKVPILPSHPLADARQSQKRDKQSQVEEDADEEVEEEDLGSFDNDDEESADLDLPE